MTTLPEDGRGYLADDLDAETEDHDEPDSTRYGEAADLLRTIDASDPLCARITHAIEPFLVNDDRIEGTLYCGGKGMRFLMEVPPPTGEPGQRLWLHDLTLGLETDRRRWDAAVAESGDATRWPDWDGPTVAV